MGFFYLFLFRKCKRWNQKWYCEATLEVPWVFILSCQLPFKSCLQLQTAKFPNWLCFFVMCYSSTGNKSLSSEEKRGTLNPCFQKLLLVITLFSNLVMSDRKEVFLQTKCWGFFLVTNENTIVSVLKHYVRETWRLRILLISKQVSCFFSKMFSVILNL